MDIKDLVKNIRNMTSYEVEQKLDYLVRSNPSYSNLSEDNKNIVLDLIKDYKQHILEGIPITEFKIHHDTHNLYENRLKLNLTANDLNNIKELLEAFKS